MLQKSVILLVEERASFSVQLDDEVAKEKAYEPFYMPTTLRYQAW